MRTHAAVAPRIQVHAVDDAATLMPFPRPAVWSSTVRIDVDVAEGQSWLVRVDEAGTLVPSGLSLRVDIAGEGVGPGWAMPVGPGQPVGGESASVVRGQGPRLGMLLKLTADAADVLRPGRYPVTFVYTVESP